MDYIILISFLHNIYVQPKKFHPVGRSVTALVENGLAIIDPHDRYKRLKITRQGKRVLVSNLSLIACEN